jgi:WD40 repeat protein
MSRFWKLLWGLVPALAVLSTGISSAMAADAENSILRNPSQPQLIYNAAGHSAIVKALLYVPDGGPLLSAGYDRVIHVWNASGAKVGLSRTIRPPIWNEPRGRIHAMAITPNPKKDGERLLAFAGTPVVSSNLTSFIQIYRFPGLNGLETGDPQSLLPQLVSREGNDDETPNASGVKGAINSLSFDGSGTLLASAGFDRRIVLWNVDTGKIVRELQDADWSGNTGFVAKVVLSKNGKLLWSGGWDGYVRLWNADTGKLLAYGPPIGLAQPAVRSPLQIGYRISALDLTADETAVIVGREDGSLVRYDAATLARPRRLIADSAMLGPVESVATHPTRHLVGLARIQRKPARFSEEPKTECLIEIRSTDDGTLVQTARTVGDRVMACAFRPDGKQFAYAGGEFQAVHLIPVTPEKPAEPVLLRGEGSTINEVGLSDDLAVVGYRRLGSDPNAPCEAFDLIKRRVISSPAPKLVATSRNTGTLGAYQVQLINDNTLRLNWGTGFQDFTWDVPLFGRWFSYCLIPAAKDWKQKQPLLAIGCEARILIYAPFVDDKGVFQYRPTRQLRGHSGAVLAMAPSADSQWLVTGGTDQIIRLWSLRDADKPSTLGATLIPNADDTLGVDSVDFDGFAHEAGLRKGDVITLAAIGETFHGVGRAKPMTEFVRNHPATLPGTMLGFTIKRGGKLANTGTRMQAHPVVSLFITRNSSDGVVQGLKVPAEREWVIWNPDGYYDTSVTADRRFLGWHRNTPNPQRTNADMLKSTSFFPIRAFEDLLRRPDVIDSLIGGQPRSAALPKDPATNEPIDVAATVDVESPPIVRLTAPAALGDAPVPVDGATLPFRVELQPGAGLPASPLRDLRILVDGQEMLQPPLPAKLGVVPIAGEIPLNTPGVHTVVFLASNEKDREQTTSFLVERRPPPRPVVVKPPDVPAKVPTLLVVSMGVGRFEDRKAFPPIPTAAADVASIVNDLFISPDVQHYFENYPDKVPVFARPYILNGDGEKPVTTASVQKTIDALNSRLRGERPALDLWNEKAGAPPAMGDGDTLVLVVSSHVIGQGKANPRLITADTKPGALKEQGIDTEEITAVLGELVRKGCRVVTIIDGYHGDDARQSVGVREWAYRLDNKGVVVCLSADNNPSPVDTQADRSPFFRALLALGVRSSWGEEILPDQRLTLDLFRRILTAKFDEETGSAAQPPYINTPATLDGSTPLFDPPPVSQALVKD